MQNKWARAILTWRYISHLKSSRAAIQEQNRCAQHFYKAPGARQGLQAGPQLGRFLPTHRPPRCSLLLKGGTRPQSFPHTAKLSSHCRLSVCLTTDARTHGETNVALTSSSPGDTCPPPLSSFWFYITESLFWDRKKSTFSRAWVTMWVAPRLGQSSSNPKHITSARGQWHAGVV